MRRIFKAIGSTEYLAIHGLVRNTPDTIGVVRAPGAPDIQLFLRHMKS
jgi:hypothetical protein